MESTRRMIRLRIALMAALAMVTLLVVATRADAAGAEVTTGRFATTATGEALGYDITGVAIMVQLPAGEDGRTQVRVAVRGLDAMDTFPAHVHNATCASGGGGHYQHDVGGAVDAVNEIWPTISTNRVGAGNGSALHGHWARPEAQSIVIHHPETGARLACAQLG
ncbi:MAG TPA: hypothetical protein VLA29_02845 [Acidimicrobiia bacterium]|nr:hypothetical protein [Acidimicrobiia bacterium]